MKAIYIVLAMLLLLVTKTVSATEGSHIYMVAKSKVTGTTLTQVVFFQSEEITTLSQCQKEVEYGLTSGWRIYTHLLRRVHGFDYATRYNCASSRQAFSRWIGRESARRVIYLVNNQNEVVSAVPQESYAACMKQVRAVQGDESHSLFCAQSSQKILASD